ncbi:MAG: hypothetical protein K1Y01_01195 [Vicinamibacteria bacterium]|nr:hypothetical protein [Vicinamibacteria bacterium]
MVVKGNRRRNARLLGLLALPAILAAAGAWKGFRVSGLLAAGAGYSAQQTCACLWVSGRALESCRTDLDPLARRLISIRVGTDEVTASGFGIATATAKYEKGFGCSLRN